MGLGSQDQRTRKAFRSITGKQDWKNAINCVQDAYDCIERVREAVANDPNGQLILATYMDDKIRLLKKYIREASHPTMTYRDFERSKKEG